VVLIIACGGAAAYLVRLRLAQLDAERVVVYIESRQEHPVVRVAVESHNLAMAIDEHYLGREVGLGAVESRVAVEIRSRVARMQQSIEELQAILGSNLGSVVAVHSAASRIGNAVHHDAKHHRRLDGEYKNTTHTFTCNRAEVRAGAVDLIRFSAQLVDLESYNHIETMRAAKASHPIEDADYSSQEIAQLQQTLASWPLSKLLVGYRYLLFATRRAMDTGPVEKILAELESYPERHQYKSYERRHERFPAGYHECRSVHSAARMLAKRYRQTSERLEQLSTTGRLAIDALDRNDISLLGDLSIKLLEELGEETAGRRTRAGRVWWPIAAGAATSLLLCLLVAIYIRVSRAYRPPAG
jgi:hypothetical protein